MPIRRVASDLKSGGAGFQTRVNAPVHIDGVNVFVASEVTLIECQNPLYAMHPHSAEKPLIGMDQQEADDKDRRAGYAMN